MSKPSGIHLSTKRYRPKPKPPPLISADIGSILVLSILMSLSAVAGLQIRQLRDCNQNALGSYHVEYSK